MMKLTLTHGLCFMSPLAFSTFGMLCTRIFPTPDEAFRYGEIGLELLNKFQVREYLPRVYAAYYACIFPWKYPLPESLDYLIHAQRVGMQTGDVEFACLCANLWGYIAVDTDVPLDEIENFWTTFQATMKSRKQKSILRMSVTCLQAIQYLQGKNVDFTVTEQLLQYSIDNHMASTQNGIRWSEAKTRLYSMTYFARTKYVTSRIFPKMYRLCHQRAKSSRPRF
jgi:predicted ATPase